MDDESIVDLYYSRSEEAIQATDRKYGRYCYSIAYNILMNREDSEETVSDTYLAAWNAIPPARPLFLTTFLGKITRNLAIDRWRRLASAKRGGGEVIIALSELEECVPSSYNLAEQVELQEMMHVYQHFLDTLPVEERRVFLSRYWYLESIDFIAKKYCFSRSKVKSMLHRTRSKLRKALFEEGYE